MTMASILSVKSALAKNATTSAEIAVNKHAVFIGKNDYNGDALDEWMHNSVFKILKVDNNRITIGNEAGKALGSVHIKNLRTI
jgi:hypothetical protein